MSLFYNILFKLMCRSKFFLYYYVLSVAFLYLSNVYKRFGISDVLEALTPRYCIRIWAFCFPYRAVLFVRTSQSPLISLALSIKSNYCLLARTFTYDFAVLFVPFNLCVCLFTLLVGLFVIILYFTYLSNRNHLLSVNIVSYTAMFSILVFCYLSGYYSGVNYAATTSVFYQWL